jgi:hypothetical protein
MRNVYEIVYENRFFRCRLNVSALPGMPRLSPQTPILQGLRKKIFYLLRKLCVQQPCINTNNNLSKDAVQPQSLSVRLRIAKVYRRRRLFACVRVHTENNVILPLAALFVFSQFISVNLSFMAGSAGGCGFYGAGCNQISSATTFDLLF